jgi:metal-responsive CopG/Arc/MetJ family transcriptional regulator
MEINLMNKEKKSSITNLEKISINIPVTELGRIDTLIEAGITANRTEFIRSSIRKELNKYENEIESIAPRKTFVIGVHHISKKMVDKLMEKNETMEIKIIGILHVDSSIKTDNLESVIKSCRVYGSIYAPLPLKKMLLNKKPRYSLLGREYRDNENEEIE